MTDGHVTSDLIYEVLKSIQARLGRIEDGQRDLKQELQGIRTHMLGTQTEIANIYGRLGTLEDRVERIERRLGLVDVTLS
jgi:archaellum component FlaC